MNTIDRHALRIFLGRVFVFLPLISGCAGDVPIGEEPLRDEIATDDQQSGEPTDAKRLAGIRSALPALKADLDALQGAGVDIAYPQVRYAAVEAFATLLEEDLANGGFDSTSSQIDATEQILEDLEVEIADMQAGDVLPDVPRYITSPITIESGACLATVQWPDGSTQDNWPINFNGYLTFDMDDLPPAMGQNAVAVEIGPSWVLPAEDVVDLEHVRVLQAYLDKAQEADVAVAVLLSPHYFPEWVWEAWPETKKTVEVVDGAHLDEYVPFFVEASEIRTVLEQYVRAVIPEIAEHPALHSLILTNEPSYFNAISDPDNQAAYAAWLEDRYGDLDALCEAHGQAYSSFYDAPIYPETATQWTPQSTDNMVAQYDYYRFNDERFAQWHAWMASIIRALAPGVPIHAKASDYVMDTPYDGIDPVLFDDFSDMAGNDSLKYYRGDQEDELYASDWIPQNKYFDLLRSIAGKPIFNSEDHVLEDEELDDVPVVHYRNVIWQSAIHGRVGSTVWHWSRSAVDEYTGEPTTDIPSIANRPLAAVEHVRTSLDLMRLGQEVHALATSPARVAIVYAPTSLLYSFEADGGLMYAWAMDGAYIALNFAGEKIDFITERQLSSGKADAYELIVAAGITHLTREAADGLADFTAKGGMLAFVADDTVLRDEYDQLIELDFTDATLIPVDEAEQLRGPLVELLERLSGGRDVVVRATEGAYEPWGVEYVHTTYNGQCLVNITNYAKHATTVTIDGLGIEGRVDLLTNSNVGATLTLEPLSTHLLAAPAGL